MRTKPARKLTLLVLDDDPSIVRLISHSLEKHFSGTIDVYSHTDPVEARQWLNSNCCDIFLSDIEMPEIDGLELLKFAKRRNAWTQVVFMTGHSTWDRISAAIESGATDYLVKPLDIDQMNTLVEGLVERFARWEEAVSGTLHATPAG